MHSNLHRAYSLLRHKQQKQDDERLARELQEKIRREAERTRIKPLFQIGDEVEINRGDNTYLSARIVSVGPHGPTPATQFYACWLINEHAQQKDVSQTRIRKATRKPVEVEVPFQHLFEDKKVIGKRVKVNYKAQGKWWFATVRAYNKVNKSYDVEYDNHVKEFGVRMPNIVFQD